MTHCSTCTYVGVGERHSSVGDFICNFEAVNVKFCVRVC